MKLPADKLRKVIQEEIQKVLSEYDGRGADYTETGFHSGSEKMSWSEVGQHPDFGLEGKTITNVEVMGNRNHVELTFGDGSTVSFFTDGQVYFNR